MKFQHNIRNHVCKRGKHLTFSDYNDIIFHFDADEEDPEKNTFPIIYTNSL